MPERFAGSYDITVYTEYFEARFILHFTDKPMSWEAVDNILCAMKAVLYRPGAAYFKAPGKLLNKFYSNT
jgi:hypothetical protein